MMDFMRLKALADMGDGGARVALITEALRRNDHALASATVAALDLGTDYPLHLWPAHLQDIPSDLACVLWQMEIIGHYRRRIHKGDLFVCAAHRHKTKMRGRKAGGWWLEIKATPRDGWTAEEVAECFDDGERVYVGWDIRATFKLLDKSTAGHVLRWEKSMEGNLLKHPIIDGLSNLIACIRYHYKARAHLRSTNRPLSVEEHAANAREKDRVDSGLRPFAAKVKRVGGVVTVTA